MKKRLTEQEIEAHRKASPYKVGCEPDYNKSFERLPRKKKKKLKAWIKKYQVKFTPAPSFVHDRFKDKKFTRAIYIDAYKWMNSIKNKKNEEKQR